MAKKTTTPKKLPDKKTKEAQKQFKRIRDELSRIRRQMKAKGFDTHGITIKDIREQPLAILSEITPKYLRSRTFINVGGMEIDINEYRQNSIYYENMLANEDEYDMYPSIYDDVIAEVKRYILSHNLDGAYAENVVNRLMNVLDIAIARDGKEDVANRLMNADWEGAIDAPFRYNKRNNALTDDVVLFAAILKDSPLNPSDLAIMSDYSLSREDIDKPHGSDL